MRVIKFYRMPELRQLTGLSQSGLYKLIREGKFPKGVKLTSRATGYRSDLVDSWIDGRMNQDGSVK
jgi:prophage regulatory protein